MLFFCHQCLEDILGCILFYLACLAFVSFVQNLLFKLRSLEPFFYINILLYTHFLFRYTFYSSFGRIWYVLLPKANHVFFFSFKRASVFSLPSAFPLYPYVDNAISPFDLVAPIPFILFMLCSHVQLQTRQNTMYVENGYGLLFMKPASSALSPSCLCLSSVFRPLLLNCT